MRHIQRLNDIVEPTLSRASSVLLTDEGRFLLGVRPPVFERGMVLLRLTGIGGWSEESENFEATAIRESLEETGSQVRLIDLAQTLVIRSPEDIRPVAVNAETAPAALVYRRFGTPPFDPWADDYRSVSPVAVYAGQLRGHARITLREEHPLFIWVYPEQLIALADSDEPLDFLLADGAEIIGAPEFDPSRAIVRLTDSIQALVSALGAGAFGFLCDIARLSQPARVE